MNREYHSTMAYKRVEWVRPRPHLTQFYTLISIERERTSKRKKHKQKNKDSKEKYLRKYASAEIKNNICVLAEYFVAVFIFSTFLTVSIGMCWLFLANSQLTKFNVYVKEDGSAHWQIFNVFYRFCNAIRVKGKHEMFQITTGTTAATTLAVCCNAEIETLNWISFDTNIKIISNSYTCNSNFLLWILFLLLSYCQV